MGEEQYISKLGELNRIIEHYSEQIMGLMEHIGRTTINKEVVTERMIRTLKSRLEELKRKRDIIENKLSKSIQEKVYA